jgi:hypothetical protein
MQFFPGEQQGGFRINAIFSSRAAGGFWGLNTIFSRRAAGDARVLRGLLQPLGLPLARLPQRAADLHRAHRLWAVSVRQLQQQRTRKPAHQGPARARGHDRPPHANPIASGLHPLADVPSACTSMVEERQLCFCLPHRQTHALFGGLPSCLSGRSSGYVSACLPVCRGNLLSVYHARPLPTSRTASERSCLSVRQQCGHTRSAWCLSVSLVRLRSCTCTAWPPGLYTSIYVSQRHWGGLRWRVVRDVERGAWPSLEVSML